MSENSSIMMQQSDWLADLFRSDEPCNIESKSDRYLA